MKQKNWLEQIITKEEMEEKHFVMEQERNIIHKSRIIVSINLITSFKNE